MRKQFFYAALAIVMMSSCSKDNDPGATDPTGPETPDVIDDTTPVAIELGINNPTVAVTRGTGSVGDIAGQAATNVWNSQKLNILMYPKNEIPASYVSPISNLEFIAPASNAGNTITIKSGDVPYYPMQNAFDFYGYHIDTDPQPAVTATEGNLTVTATIDGTNDVMAAIASVTPEDQKKLLNNYYKDEGITFAISAAGDEVVQNGGAELTASQKVVLAKEKEKAFSSYAARREIQPSLAFKHLLTRLKFNVKAGEKQAAKDQYEEGGDYLALAGHKFPNVTDEMLAQLATPGTIIDADPNADGPEADMTDGAVYIYSIKVTDQKNGITLTFKPGTAPTYGDGESITAQATPPTYTSEFTGTDGIFTLMGRDNTSETQPTEAVDLTPTATERFNDKTPVGESMMVAPEQESFKIEIVVMQYVVTNTNESSYTWKLSQLTTTVKAPTKMPDPENQGGSIDSTDKTENGNYCFAAGKSYNINVTVYGYQKIEIDAVLTGWIAGEDVEVNPEDDAFNN